MNYQVIRSGRKTLSVEVNSKLEIIVRAPLRCSNAVISAYLKDKEAWINKAILKMQKRRENTAKLPTLTEAQLRALYIKAKTAIPPKVDYYAAIIGVSYGRISIRNQTSRWGSCSSKGNLNFNCKLMLLDDELIDYVVVHELCHRLQMNHSPAFWAEVERIIPDYRLRRKRLKESGAL